ncbi:MAG: hypothetical protein GY909_16240 [Oligoflexia bacterium]|nr:hypothetical protein [Oligoflexia bacterium]
MSDDKKIVKAFSREFQREIASIILNDPIFCSRYYHIVYQDKDLQKKKIQIFNDSNLDKVMKDFFNLYSKHEVAISEGIFKNFIHSLSITASEKSEIIKTYKETLDFNAEYSEHHEDELVNLLKSVKAITFYEKIQEKYFLRVNLNKLEKFQSEVEEFLSQLEKITFAKSDIIKLDNYFNIIEEASQSANRNIKTGLAPIDQVLNGGGEFGGIARGEITMIASAVNDGKSILLNTIIKNAIALSDADALHINLEGKRLQSPLRFISNTTSIPYKRIVQYRDFKNDGNIKSIKEYFKPDEVERIENAQKKFGEKLRVCHEIANPYIEDILSLCEEMYKEKPFDLLTIDYGQIVWSKKPFARRDLEIGYIFRQVETFCSVYNIAGVIPMQVKGEAMKALDEKFNQGIQYPTYTKYDIADCKKATDSSGTILTWNRTEVEKANGTGRLSILKEREGATGLQILLRPNWNCADLFSGEILDRITGESGNSTQKTKVSSLLDNIKSSIGLDAVINDENFQFVLDQISSSKLLTEADKLDRKVVKTAQRLYAMYLKVNEEIKRVGKELINENDEVKVVKLTEENEELLGRKENIVRELRSNEVFKEILENKDSILETCLGHKDFYENLDKKELKDFSHIRAYLFIGVNLDKWVEDGK